MIEIILNFFPKLFNQTITKLKYIKISILFILIKDWNYIIKKLIIFNHLEES
jgi:hypothetical protein